MKACNVFILFFPRSSLQIMNVGGFGHNGAQNPMRKKDGQAVMRWEKTSNRRRE